MIMELGDFIESSFCWLVQGETHSRRMNTEKEMSILEKLSTTEKKKN
jgi:hypothetical protein